MRNKKLISTQGKKAGKGEEENLVIFSSPILGKKGNLKVKKESD